MVKKFLIPSYTLFNNQYINNSFISQNIRNYCNNNFKYEVIFNIRPNITLSIASKNKIVPVVNEIVKIVESMTNAFPHDKNLLIKYLPTPFKKHWNGEEILTTHNVNSGYSQFSENQNIIVVFRKEEYLKVLIHELIHATERHCISPGSIIESNSKHHLDECIVETWATILNLHRILDKNFIVSDEKYYYNYIFKTQLFENEKIFCLKQAAKILKSHSCDYDGNNCKRKIPDSPAIFCYYILKAALLSDPERFVSEFSLSSIKKCNSIEFSSILDYCSNEKYIEKIEYFFNDKFFSSMVMTKYGDYKAE